MDFDFTPEQDDAAELARQILVDRATNARQQEVERGGDRFDRELWRELGAAGLLSLAIPEQHGGAGLGLVELCRVLVEVGKTVAPVPLAVHGPAALAIAELGTDEQQQRWLPGAATRRAGAHRRRRRGARAPPRPPDHDLDRRSARRQQGAGARGRRRRRLPGHRLARRRRARSPGCSWSRPGPRDSRSSSSTSPTATSSCGSTWPASPAERLGGADAADGAATRLAQLLVVAAVAEQLGVTEGALALTASYARTREQFGRPIGTFQAVSQRLADGYIDVLGQGLTLWQAAWRLQEGLPAEVEVATAKLWAADAGHRLAHTTVHVHGGVGIDLDGEAHRYFTTAKRFEFLYGGATEQALRVGRVLAAEPA